MDENGNGNGKYNAEMMIEAIRKAEGNLSDAARILGCARMTVHRYVNKYATVKQAYEDENEKFLDEAEGQLRKAVKRGQLPAVMFALKTKGRSRGYQESKELTGPDNGPIVFRVIYDE